MTTATPVPTTPLPTAPVPVGRVRITATRIRSVNSALSNAVKSQERAALLLDELLLGREGDTTDITERLSKISTDLRAGYVETTNALLDSRTLTTDFNAFL